jgi:hypothetical protein
MFIDKDTLKRINIYGPYKGFSKLDTPEIRERAGLIEIPDPVRGDDNLFYNQEIDDAPYLIVTPKPQEQLARQQADKDKRNAESHLASTDYLFNIDRHDLLLKDEPLREEELRKSREAARAVIRQYKLDYPREG